MTTGNSPVNENPEFQEAGPLKRKLKVSVILYPQNRVPRGICPMFEYSARPTVAEGDVAQALAVMKQPLVDPHPLPRPLWGHVGSLDGPFATLHATLLIETYDRCQNSTQSCECCVTELGIPPCCVLISHS